MFLIHSAPGVLGIGHAGHRCCAEGYRGAVAALTKRRHTGRQEHGKHKVRALENNNLVRMCARPWVPSAAPERKETGTIRTCYAPLRTKEPVELIFEEPK